MMATRKYHLAVLNGLRDVRVISAAHLVAGLLFVFKVDDTPKKRYNVSTKINHET